MIKDKKPTKLSEELNDLLKEMAHLQNYYSSKMAKIWFKLNKIKDDAKQS